MRGLPSSPGPHTALRRRSGGARSRLSLQTWTPKRTPQAILDLRSVWVVGQWKAFQLDRIEWDRERLYPHRDLVAGEAFLAPAP